ncbi:MAG: T9SS type A sorting domain-containing protein [Chitinophagaceae bacterium]|nr:T9SS type A sorting domain-containing protein [Chitinophagaceae bacterium]
MAGKTFPVGHSKYNPLIIENGNSYEWKVSVYDSITADPPQNTTGAVNVTWQIEPSDNPPASGADSTLQFDIANQVGGASILLLMAYSRYRHGSKNKWILAGCRYLNHCTVMGNTRTVKVSGLTEFCPYALARTGLPLPIKLISFDAMKISSSSSRLSWELAACCSSAARFEIERSTDARNYSLLTFLPGSETNRFYAYTDTRLAKGITYYRLKMTDADGKISYSNVVAVINDKAGLLITSLSPNPVQSQATLSITNAGTGPVQFAIYDLRGRVVQQWQGNTGEGSTTFTLQLGGLREGVYHLLATGAGARSVYRFIKQ